MNGRRRLLHKAVGISAALLVVLGVTSTVLAQERETPQALFEQIVRDPGAYAAKSGAGEQFGWGVAYYAGGFVEGYRRTKDTAWLDGAVEALGLLHRKDAHRPRWVQGMDRRRPERARHLGG